MNAHDANLTPATDPRHDPTRVIRAPRGTELHCKHWIAEAAYRFGERGFLDVLDAQRVYRAARNELIVARYELAQAWVEIERWRSSQ